MNRRTFLKTAGAVSALGAVPSIGRAQGKEVKLGYILPVTGPLAFEAQLSLNGLQLAVDEVASRNAVCLRSRRSRSPLMRRSVTAIRIPTIKGTTRTAA
jgi:hypothetical protein